MLEIMIHAFVVNLLPLYLWLRINYVRMKRNSVYSFGTDFWAFLADL